MVPKPQAVPASKPAEAPAASTPAATSQEPAEKKEETPMEEDKKTEEPEKKPEETTETPSATETTSAPATPATTGTTPGADIVVGEELNGMVQNIMDMGYERNQVIYYIVPHRILGCQIFGHRHVYFVVLKTYTCLGDRCTKS